MEWIDVLRLLAAIGMGYGAWAAYKSVVVVKHGRRYYRQKDGNYRTFWGRRVRDPALVTALEARCEASQRPTRGQALLGATLRSAKRVRLVPPIGHRLEPHPTRVDHQQAPDKPLAEADDLADYLHGHQRPHRAG